jgi:hypothetical protein
MVRIRAAKVSKIGKKRLGFFSLKSISEPLVAFHFHLIGPNNPSGITQNIPLRNPISHPYTIKSFGKTR